MSAETADSVGPPPHDSPELQDAPLPEPTRVAGPKFDPGLLQELRGAVVHLRGRGRPLFTLQEALDEAVMTWLTKQRNEMNGGNPFAPIGALRTTRRRRRGA